MPREKPVPLKCFIAKCSLKYSWSDRSSLMIRRTLERSLTAGIQSASVLPQIRPKEKILSFSCVSPHVEIVILEGDGLMIQVKGK